MKKTKSKEMKLYECLGVLQFQKLVFLLEKLIHYKDKKKNINYHIKNYSIDELKNFQKFLYYNGFIHVKNALFLMGFLAVQTLFLSDLLLIYIIPSLIKNIYCVMLQRYNYIRINKTIETKQKLIDKKSERRKTKFIEESKTLKEIKDKDKCLQQIDSLKKFLQGEEDAILDNSSLESLYLIREFLNPSEETKTSNNKESDIKKAAMQKKIGGR